MSSFTVSYKRANSNIIKATLTSVKEAKSRSAVYPIIVLDQSGSMAGNRIAECIKAIQHILTKVGAIRLIGYSQTAQDYGLLKSLNRANASGSTSFMAAYRAIVDIVKKDKIPQQVIFMTDGEDTVNRTVPADREWLRKELIGTTCVIHTIGIESESHTQHMLDLSKCGSSEGTYGYFSKGNYQEEADRLISLIGSHEIVFQGKQYFLGTDPISVYVEDSVMDCGTPDFIDEIEYLAHRANELVRQGNAAPLKEIQLLREQAQMIFVAAGRQPRVIRKSVRERLNPVHDLIAEFYNLVHSKQTITHEKLAHLNVAARNARTNRFAKNVVDRTDQNIQILEKEDTELIVLTKEMAKIDVKDQPTDMSCMLSLMLLPELLQDGDCIGLGIRATVRETCIVDPTLLQIDGISTSHFGCAAFLEAATYSVGNDKIEYGTSTNVVVDSSRTPVSGVLPLYLNATHWKIAKLYLRRMAGHLCCKDPMLGNDRTTFYTYLHVYRFCRSQKGEYFTRLTEMVCETLKNIYIMMPFIIATPDAFCTDINKRMPNVTPSVTLLQEAYSALALPCPVNLQDYMVEEKLRRQKKTLEIQSVCVIDENYWVKPFVRANIPSKSTGVYVNLLKTVTLDHPDALKAFKATVGDSQEKSETKEEIFIPDLNDFKLDITLPDWVILDNFNKDFSPARKALITLQACELSGVTECTKNYVDYIAMPEGKILSTLVKRCSDYINLRRSAELTSVTNNMRRNDVGGLIGNLNRGVSFLERVASLHGSCYVGRNIGEFAATVNNFEEFKLLALGKCDIGPLIGYPKEVIITTVMDIDLRHRQTTPSVHGSERFTYSNRWVPSFRKLKSLCALYTREQMMSIFPEAKLIIDTYSLNS